MSQLNIYQQIRADSRLNGTEFGRLLSINKHAVSTIEHGRRIPNELQDGLYDVIQRAAAHKDYTPERLRAFMDNDLMSAWCFLFQLGFDGFVMDDDAGTLKLKPPVTGAST